MKRILAVAMVLLALAMCSSSADRRNFWILNNTGQAITRFYIAVHGSGQPWGNDVLGSATLPSALGTVIFFYDSNVNCVYDFRIGYADGTYLNYVQGRNLCQNHAVQFNQNTNDAF